MDGLEVRNIRKVYGAVPVVDNVSFQAKKGQIMGILGPNGAGKTTTIRMIMGITAPDSGEIWFTNEGTKTSGVPRSTVGYLPEERGLYKEAKVMNILQFLAGLKGVGRSTAKKRALEWLKKFDLEEQANAKIEQLSKGMAQKVQFIASILHEPKFIVLDEPFSGLDPVSQDLFKAAIRNLASEGAAVLLSSHQMNIVEELCDEIFLIDKGQEVVYGDLQSIKEQYGNYRVHILGNGDIQTLASSPLVESIEQLTDTRSVLILKDKVQPAEFLRTIPAEADIKELSVTRPSLHDIFVKIAKGGLKDEGYLEDR